MENKHTTSLRGFLSTKGGSIPSWMEDLLLNGPRLEEWKDAPTRPNRVLVTEFLARWLKDQGLAQEECLAWLEPYCCEVLAPYSKSGRSAIRHGTKANIRWVYTSDFRFDFEAMANEASANNPDAAPVYLVMLQMWNTSQWDQKEAKRKAYVPPVFEPFVPKKQRFREQFERALAIAQQKKSEGEAMEQITEFLNEQGFLTITGRKWTMATVFRSLKQDATSKMWHRIDESRRAQSTIPAHGEERPL